MWKLGKQPEEMGGAMSKVGGKSEQTAAGRTKAAGFPVASADKNGAGPSLTKFSPKENALTTYQRKSGNIKPAESGTPKPGATAIKGEPSI